MANSYDTVYYMLPCLNACIYCGCVNCITVNVTLIHTSFCLRDAMQCDDSEYHDGHHSYLL